MKRLAASLALLALVSSAHAAPGEKSPLKLTSITPHVAQRGELVTVTGGGFGGKNVVITVGGARVPVVDATDLWASFRVPLLGQVGRVTVRLRNPGGHSGEIGLTVLFDGNTTADGDEVAAVSAPIDSQGGTIEVDGMTLAIPAGSVPQEQMITVTPLRSLRGSPFAATPVGVMLEPSGLVLLKPATLTLPRPTGAGAEQIVATFGFNGDGEGLHLVPHVLSSDAVAIQVWHFSGAGTVIVSRPELEAMLSYEPSQADQLAQQQIAAALAQAALAPDDFPPGKLQELIDAALLAWYDSSVRSGLQVARTGPLAYFELAFGEWQAWLGEVALYSSSSWTQQIPEANGLALLAAGKQANTLLRGCTGPDIPLAALRNSIRLANVVTLGVELPIEQLPAEDGSGRHLPNGGDLPTACLLVQTTGIEHPAVLAGNRSNRFTAQAQVVFWEGAPSTSIPLHYRLADTTDGPPVLIGSDTTSNGRFETTVHPTTNGLRFFDLTVDLAAAATDDVLRAFFDRASMSILVRERLQLQALSPAAIAAGDTVNLRVSVAGNGMSGASVGLAVISGPGSVSASSLTTDAQGAATAVYTAPSSPSGSGNATVSATLPDALPANLTITFTVPITVSISPTAAILNAGSTAQFTATVTGTTNTAVNWNATGGTISTSGLYTAGSASGSFGVSATSVADTTMSAAAAVTVSATASGFEGSWTGTYTRFFSGFGFVTEDLLGTILIEPAGVAGQLVLSARNSRMSAFSVCGSFFVAWWLVLDPGGNSFTSTEQGCGGFVFAPDLFGRTLAGRLEGASIVIDSFCITQLEDCALDPSFLVSIRLTRGS